MRFTNYLGSCEITSLPGCDQIAVSHSAWIMPNARNKGHGKYNHKLRLKRMKEMLYDVALCTTISTNDPQNHILETNGWQKVHSFVSHKTGSTIYIWIRGL